MLAVWESIKETQMCKLKNHGHRKKHFKKMGQESLPGKIWLKVNDEKPTIINSVGKGFLDRGEIIFKDTDEKKSWYWSRNRSCQFAWHIVGGESTQMRKDHC